MSSAFATVVIGHSMHCRDYYRSDVSETLRIYNSHLSRIDVITYETPSPVLSEHAHQRCRAMVTNHYLSRKKTKTRTPGRRLQTVPRTFDGATDGCWGTPTRSRSAAA